MAAGLQVALLVAVCGFFIIQVLHSADGGAVLSVKLTSYRNPSQRDYKGKCCDGPNFGCLGRCDHRFKFCFDSGFRDDDMNRCLYKVIQTGEFLDQDNINFDHDIHGAHNPLKINMLRWPGSVELKLYVEDDDSGFNNHDPVDYLFYVYSAKPARSFNEASSWHRKVIRGNRTKTDPTSLTTDWVVWCEENYYGSECYTYCKAQNSTRWGHYTCDPDTGAKICRIGYEDPSTNCVILADDCLNHKCADGSMCVDGIQNYTCACPPGFSGMYCENNIDECQDDLCQNGGSCVDGIEGYQCKCAPGFVGDKCEYHICSKEDNHTHCENGGTCYGDGDCLCTPAFAGKTCEIDKCRTNFVTCYNGGTCSKGRCDCPKGFVGIQCDVDLCDHTDCDNGGTCYQGTCSCAPGFSGKHCQSQSQECVSNPCQHEGTCVDQVNGYYCRCTPYYRGENCQDPVPPSVSMKLEEILPKEKGENDVDPIVGAAKQEPQNQNGFPPFVGGLIGGLFILLAIIVILLALLMRYRRKKKKVPTATLR